MTQHNNTASGAAIQRYKIGYYSDDWGVRSSSPSGIPDASGAWVRYADHVAALVEAQQPAQAAAAAGFIPVAAFDRLHAHAESLAARLMAAPPQQEAQEPCPTCAALARTVMLDQVSFDRRPDCYGIRQITDDEGVEEWEGIRTSPDVAREEANDMKATGRGEIYEVVPLWTTPQPAPSVQAASSAVLKAIREANMQLVRTGDDAFMLVPYKVATPQSDSVLEDAERYRWLFDARSEAQVANVHDTLGTPMPQDEVLSRLQGFYMSKAHVDAIVDAARKQGATP